MRQDYRFKESLFIVPNKDRVLVMLSLDFMGDTDRAIASVFLNQFTEAQRKLPAAPPVLFNVKPPTELLTAFPGLKEDPSLVGYIFFTVLKMHVDKPAKIRSAALLLATFRTYIHYHIKGAKTYLQSRMRMRCELMLKVLNRANPEAVAAESSAGRRNTNTGAASGGGKTFRKF
jgi:actin related protein 2/3 complex subunit 2